jgi:hypothetical protein
MRDKIVEVRLRPAAPSGRYFRVTPPVVHQMIKPLDERGSSYENQGDLDRFDSGSRGPSYRICNRFTSARQGIIFRGEHLD